MKLWNWFKSLFTKKPDPVIRPDEVIEPVKDPAGELTMSERVYAALLQHKGMKEVKGSGNNPQIVNMFKVVTGKEYPDSTPWCALYMCYCLIQAGFKNFNTLLARDFLKVGLIVDLDHAVEGDIVIFKRGNSSWQGHVTGFVRRDGSRILCLGGNQSDSVSLAWYQVDDLLGVRRMSKEDLRDAVAEEDPEIIPSWGKNFFFSQEDYDEINKLISSYLSPLVPKDISTFSKSYKDMDMSQRNEFWMVFLSAMSEKESNHNTDLVFKESFNDSKGKKVLSRGLFQLSVESVNGYKKFAPDYFALVNERTLHHKVVNTAWAIIILSRWIKADGVIYSKSSPWKGGARYWSVLRNNGNTQFIINDCLKRYE